MNNLSGENKKRERDRSLIPDGLAAKIPKTSYNRISESKQNGRSSYHKVSNYSNQTHISTYNNDPMQNLTHIVPPPITNFFYYPPPSSMPPLPTPNMNVPPPLFIFDQQMYPMYQAYPRLYPPPPPVDNIPPPLPQDAPPVAPPPPPPEDN